MATTNIRRWLGLSSYEEKDAEIFYGREKEIEELAGDIFHNTQTVIYGPSGTGKTSILRAGIFKKAREERFFPIYIRLNHETEESYAQQILNEIQEKAENENIEIEKRIDYINDQCSSLWEFFHCHIFWNADNYPVTPLFVIDQFEELFTISKNNCNISDFFEQLSDLCDDKYPLYIKEHLAIQDTNRIQYPEKVNYRIVISLREDFLARLEEYANFIPALKRNRYSLQAINEEQAMDIILKPAQGIVMPEIAIEIIQKVTNRKDFKIDGIPEIIVEPALLSLFCNELDKKRIERGLSVISLELVREFGDNIIKDFYLRVMSQIDNNTVNYLENSLLTGDGFRDNVALKDAFSRGVTKQELDFLQSNRLIRIEEWDGAKRIEFTHDVLCKVAMEHRNNRKRILRLEEEKAKTAKLKRRNRSMLIALLVGIFTVCSISIFIWDGYYREIEKRYANFGKQDGWFIGINELTADEASYLSCHYVFKKKGRASKRWVSMEARNGYDKLTTNHSCDIYLLNQFDDEDMGANEEMKEQLQQVCQWELIPNATGDFLLQERAYDKDKKLIYCYNRGQTNNLSNVAKDILLKERAYDDKDRKLIYRYNQEQMDNSKQVFGTFTDGLGFPIKIRDEAGYFFIRITSDDRGFETLYEFYDEDGFMQKNKDGAYQTEKKYLDNGLQIEEASLNIDGKRTIDRWGNCGWVATYEGYNLVKSTYLNENNEPCRIKISNQSITRKCKYDSHNRIKEMTFWDEKDKPDLNNEGVHGYLYVTNRHGQDTHAYRLNINGEKSIDNSGWLDYHREYDKNGNEILSEMVAKDSIHGNRYVYSDSDELLERYEYKVLYGDTTYTYFYKKNLKDNTELKYFKGDCYIRAKYDEKNNLTYWAYFDTLNINPIMKFGYHCNKMDYQYQPNYTSYTDIYYDINNKICQKEDNEFAYQIYRIDSLRKSEITSQYDTAQQWKSSWESQYNETYTKIIAQKSLGMNNEPERNPKNGAFYYKTLINYSIKPTIHNNSWTGFIGLNEFDEASLIGGGDLLYYRSKFDKKGNTIYFDEKGEEITDMEQYIASTPKVLTIALKDSAAIEVGLRSNDIIIRCNEWKMQFDDESNNTPFYGLPDIIFSNHERKLSVMRFLPEERRQSIVEINLPETFDIDNHTDIYYLYYTQKEKERMENIMNEYSFVKEIVKK